MTHAAEQCPGHGDPNVFSPPHVWFPIGCFPHKPHVCGNAELLGITIAPLPKRRINAQAKGKRFELRLVKYLRDHGFPDARRTVRTGYRTKTEVAQDEGDIDGTPRLCLQMKALKNELTPGIELDRIHGETVAQADGRMPLLVNHRNGYADPGRWWLWLDVADLLELFGADRDRADVPFLLRVSLGDVINELRWYSQRGMG